ncbi:ribosomal-protein-alanine N-acetyltransferase [Pseudoduganella flava]|uniref:GNAT family N-acetyltransferase n=1 Tax=Pseudoduganella flava TaxID=871742 RepID=A0A562PGK1_9BURK|nr:GNAT family N-acetyltransferase [Pseudoduganella flava]QGZ43133.1 GNAT family N-acetyltransferase [Pseudoduganella flava]TWI43567.1 ribosomal-protein-alanine N-acetyltransferase [Pseudoduganella flava]
MGLAFVDIATISPATLLAFEEANRAYFESMIDGRAPSFYSLEGVAQHVAGLREEAERGTAASFVIADAAGALLGRANLKRIDTAAGSAEIGYRIGADHAGKGIATRAVAFLLDEARDRGLATVEALVLASNAASARVLDKCGFVPAAEATGITVTTARGTEGTRRYRISLA